LSRIRALSFILDINEVLLLLLPRTSLMLLTISPQLHSIATS
jgi:hypothetical protein